MTSSTTAARLRIPQLRRRLARRASSTGGLALWCLRILLAPEAPLQRRRGSACARRLQSSALAAWTTIAAPASWARLKAGGRQVGLTCRCNATRRPRLRRLGSAMSRLLLLWTPIARSSALDDDRGPSVLVRSGRAVSAQGWGYDRRSRCHRRRSQVAAHRSQRANCNQHPQWLRTAVNGRQDV